MFEVEWTRVLLSFFVGYFLTISGSLSQIVTQNNLASPSTLGFDGVAVIGIIASQIILSLFGLKVSLELFSFLSFCIFFALLLVSMRYFRPKNKLFMNQNIQVIILIGLGFNLFVGAIFSVIQFLFMALSFEFPTGIWFGNFKYYSILSLWLFLIVFILLQVFIHRLSPKLRLLSIGHEFSLGLGVDVKKTQKHAILVSLFLTGLVISFFGVFSFLGLIFPHILRLLAFFRYNMRNELLYGPIITGALFCGLDILCYNFDIYGAELPVGMVSSVFGSMVLLFLLFKKHILKFQ